MGSMLAMKFIESGKILPRHIAVYNRTPEKMNALVKSSGVEACENNLCVAEKSDLIFVCVRPEEVKDVLLEIRPRLDERKTIVSVASDVSLEKLTGWSGINAVRVIPSITSESLAGVSVIVFGDEVQSDAREEIFSLFGSISRPFVTTEDKISLMSDLTSSSPAIIASIIQQYALAAARKGGVSKDDAEFLVKETFIGTAKLILENDYEFGDLISRVSTKGGITAEGVAVVEKEIPPVFDNVLLKMEEKHRSTGDLS